MKYVFILLLALFVTSNALAQDVTITEINKKFSCQQAADGSTSILKLKGGNFVELQISKVIKQFRKALKKAKAKLKTANNKKAKAKAKRQKAKKQQLLKNAKSCQSGSPSDPADPQPTPTQPVELKPIPDNGSVDFVLGGPRKAEPHPNSTGGPDFGINSSLSTNCTLTWMTSDTFFSMNVLCDPLTTLAVGSGTILRGFGTEETKDYDTYFGAKGGIISAEATGISTIFGCDSKETQPCMDLMNRVINPSVGQARFIAKITEGNATPPTATLIEGVIQ